MIKTMVLCLGMGALLTLSGTALAETTTVDCSDSSCSSKYTVPKGKNESFKMYCVSDGEKSKPSSSECKPTGEVMTCDNDREGGQNYTLCVCYNRTHDHAKHVMIDIDC